MSNEITVNIDDYLSHDEKAQIARDAFRSAAEMRSNADFERILSNASYHLVEKEVDAVFNGGMAALVRDKSVAIINNLSEFSVLRRPDAWGCEASKAWVHLQKAMDDAAPMIHARVQKIISDMSEEKLREMVEYEIVNAIVGKLTAPVIA